MNQIGQLFITNKQSEHRFLSKSMKIFKAKFFPLHDSKKFNLMKAVYEIENFCFK